MEIKARPAAKFGEGRVMGPPTNSQRTRMNGAHRLKLSLSGGTEGRVGNPGNLFSRQISALLKSVVGGSPWRPLREREPAGSGSAT
jgi:hypothetical protein